MKNGYQNLEQDRRIQQLEDHWIKLNEEFGYIKTDVQWLCKTYWVIAGASITAVIVGIINLIGK
jgi:hypothetical protein